MLQAAERRAQEQAARGVKGITRLPKEPSADLPINTKGTNLRWQVG